MNLDHPERFRSRLGRACLFAEKYAEAAEAFSRITRPDDTQHAFLAATFAQMGNAVAAAAHAAEVLKREPKFSVAVYLATQHSTSARSTASATRLASSRQACQSDPTKHRPRHFRPGFISVGWRGCVD